MRAGQVASTARGVALLRALEMTRQPADRLCADPYAKAFVNPLTLAGLRLWQALRLDRLTGIAPMMTFALARERYIHELIVREARDGLGQVVILGAGYDTRAYRIPELARVRVFEVDHPHTQAAKRRALRGIVEPLPPNVSFVAVDFDREDLGAALGTAGYDPSLRTLFVWQGVTVYLMPEGIDATLRFVAEAAPQSVLVFDYLDRDALTSRSMGMLRLFTRALGEAMSFGIAAGDLRPMLGRLGFTDTDIVDGPALRSLYPAAGDRPMAGGVGIVVARVCG